METFFWTQRSAALTEAILLSAKLSNLDDTCHCFSKNCTLMTLGKPLCHRTQFLNLFAQIGSSIVNFGFVNFIKLRGPVLVLLSSTRCTADRLSHCSHLRSTPGVHSVCETRRFYFSHASWQTTPQLLRKDGLHGHADRA